MLKLTELEKKLLKVMDVVSCGDTQYPGTDDHAWFGLMDDEFTSVAQEHGITSKTISGLTSSLVQKGVVAIDELDNEHYYYVKDSTFKSLKEGN